MDSKNKPAKRSQHIIMHYFPEIGAGDYSSLDGTVEFYGRIQALLRPDMQILDFGAGRGAGIQDDVADFRKDLRIFKGKVNKVIACDVDEAVLDNPGFDETVVIKPDEPLPFDDAVFDMIVADFVFEHIAGPGLVSFELQRILKPGGWICARTPNKYCLVSLATRLFSNSHHSRLLSRIQPERKSIDIFPTMFKLNTKRDINIWFKPEFFDNFTYRYEAEPSYFFNSRIVFAVMLLINRLSPPVMKSGLFVFLRKKKDGA